MKNKKINTKNLPVLLWLIMLLPFSGIAQPGNQCTTAVALTGTPQTYTDSLTAISEEWFSFVAISDEMQVQVISLNPSAATVHQMQVFGGSCTSLNNVGLLFGDVSLPLDTLTADLHSITIGATYYVKVSRFEPPGCRDCNPAAFAPFKIQASLPVVAVCDCGELFPTFQSQNLCELICNGGFDLYKSSFDTLDYLNGINTRPACPWQMFNVTSGSNPISPTPDLYNTFTSVPTVTGVPNNLAGTEVSATPPINGQSGYAGLVCRGSPGQNYREYVSAPLQGALSPGQQYKISFKVSLVENAGYATDRIGAYLTATPQTQTNGIAIVVPNANLQAVSNGVITNLTWTTISNTFIANGTEAWITIGQFGLDNTSTVVPVTPLNPNSAFSNYSYYYIDDVSLVPFPDSMSVTATPNTVCNGDTVSLMATTNSTGSPTYTWSSSPFGGLQPSTTGSAFAVPTGSATYTCQINLPAYNNCALKDSASVTWLPGPSFVNAGADINLCQTDTVHLTGSNSFFGVNDFYWLDANGTQLCSQCTTFDTIVSPPTFFVFYSANSNSGCSRTDTMYVNLLPNPSSAISGITSGCDSAATYCPTSQIVGATYTWQVWDAGYTTQVPFNNLPFNCIQVDWFNSTNAAGGIVILTASTPQGCTSSDTFFVQACCRNPINGSYLYNATLNVSQQLTGVTRYVNGTLTIAADIHLKQCIFNMAPGSLITVSGGNTLRIDETQVRGGCCEMWDAIEANNITDSVIAYNNSYIGDGIRGIVSNNGAVYQVYGNTTFNRNLTSITVNPYPGNHGGTVQQSNFISVVTPYCTPSQNTLLPPYNGQKPMYGIKVNGQVVNITVGNGTAPGFANTFDGLNNGIRANKTNIRVVNCNFKNINVTAASKAVWTSAATGLFGYKTLRIGTGVTGNYQRCVFENCRTGISADTNMSVTAFRNKFYNNTGVIAGYTAILVQNARHAQNLVTIQLDTIYNHNRGIHCVQNSKATHQLVQNYIEITQPVTSPQGTGLLVLDLAGNSATYNIYNNRIYKVRFGISASGLINATIHQNKVRVRPSNVTLLSATGITLTASTGCDIAQNEINSTSLNLNTQNGGILVSGNISGRVICNMVDSLGYGIQFSGANNGSQTVRRNSLTRLTHGIWLSNGAIIMAQGSPTVPQDNQWFGAIANRCYSSGPANNVTIGGFSPFFYRAGITFNPNPSNADVTNNNSPITTTLISTSLPIPPSCIIFPQAMEPQEQIMEEIAQGTINANNPDPLWVSQESMYRSFREDSTLYINSQVLTDFKDSVDLEATGKLYNSYADLTNANLMPVDTLTDAVQKTDMIAPTNNGEDNMKQVVFIALNSFEQGRAYTPGEIGQLQLIASLCPFTDGDAVYFARTLLSPFDTTEYVNNCELGIEQNLRPETFGQSGTAPEIPVTVYPNPNHGAITVTYKIGEQDKAEMFFYALTGSLVKTVTLENRYQRAELSLADLEPGAYLYMVKVNGEIRKSDRMVIIK